MNLLGNAVTHSFPLIPCLDSEDSKDVPMYADECQEDVFYEEPGLSRGVEGMDYEIRYGVDDNESN